MEEDSVEDNSRKRSADSPGGESNAPKRSRQSSAATTTKPTTARALLQVPLSFILRRSLNNTQPLLSRSEADCFLRLRSLAHHLDCIVNALSSTASLDPEDSAIAPYYQQHPYLRPVVVIQATVQLQPQHLMEDCITEFHAVEATLQQWAEQNWTVAETLRGVVPAVAMEKQHVSDVQDEVCRRIGMMLAVSSSETTASADGKSTNEDVSGEGTTSKGDSLDSLVSMEEYCSRLFPEDPVDTRNEVEPKSDDLTTPQTGKRVPEEQNATKPASSQRGAVDKAGPTSRTDPAMANAAASSTKQPSTSRLGQEPWNNGDSSVEASMVLTDLLTASARKGKDDLQDDSSKDDDDESAVGGGTPFRSQGAAEVLCGFSTNKTGAS